MLLYGKSGTVSKAKQSRVTNCFCFSRKTYRDVKKFFNLVFWTTLSFLEPQNLSLLHALSGVCLPIALLVLVTVHFPSQYLGVK